MDALVGMWNFWIRIVGYTLIPEGMFHQIELQDLTISYISISACALLLPMKC